MIVAAYHTLFSFLLLTGFSQNVCAVRSQGIRQVYVDYRYFKISNILEFSFL